VRFLSQSALLWVKRIWVALGDKLRLETLLRLMISTKVMGFFSGVLALRKKLEKRRVHKKAAKKLQRVSFFLTLMLASLQ
jgi:hypothetical protein